MAIQLYKRANDKVSSEKDSKDPSKQKWNAGAVCVKVDNEYIPISELTKLVKVTKSNGFIAAQKVENEIEIDGETHDMNNLIDLYRSSKQNMTDKEDPALQAAIKGMKKYDSKGNEIAGSKEGNDDVVLEKKNEDAGKEELEKGEEKGSEKGVVKEGKNKKMKDNDSDEGFVKDTTKEGKKNEDDVEDKDEEMKKDNEMDEEEEKENEFVSEKNPGKKNDKKDVRHFLRLNSARENGTAEPGLLTIDTMHSRVNRGKDKYGTNNN